MAKGYRKHLPDFGLKAARLFPIFEAVAVKEQPAIVSDTFRSGDQAASLELVGVSCL